MAAIDSQPDSLPVLCSRAGWALLITVAFFWATDLISNPREIYSSYTEFRRQTEVLLSLRLALSDSPTALGVDHAWHQGVHQVWGLGVPLIRMPFELLAQGLGRPYFPDRLLPLLGCLAAAWLLLGMVADCLARSGARPTHFPLLGIALSLWLLGCPLFIALCNSRFQVYEEAAAFSYLWAIIALALSGRALFSSSFGTVSAAALVLGFGPLIRPTMAAYSLPLVLVLLLSAGQALRPRARLLVLGLFSLGPAGLLCSNFLRFGSPWEFGHSLNMSIVLPHLLAVRFGYPFSEVPLATAARELAGALMLNALNGYDFYRQNFFSGQADVFRFREFYFPGFSPFYMLVALSSWLLLLFAAGLIALRPGEPGRQRLRVRILLLGSATLAAAALLAVFYLRVPCLTSRYFLDFAPALAFAPVALLLLLRTFSTRWGNLRNDLLFGMLTAPLLYYAVADIRKIEHSPAYNSRDTAPIDQSALTNAMRHWHTSRLVLDWPTEYSCEDLPGKRIFFWNTLGWEAPPLCRVGEISQFFFADPQCLELEISFWEPDYWDTLRRVLQVKIGRYTLAQQSTRLLSPQRAQLSYCAAPGEAFRGIQLVSIAWVDPAQLGRSTPAIALNRIRSSSWAE